MCALTWWMIISGHFHRLRYRGRHLLLRWAKLALFRLEMFTCTFWWRQGNWLRHCRYKISWWLRLLLLQQHEFLLLLDDMLATPNTYPWWWQDSRVRKHTGYVTRWSRHLTNTPISMIWRLKTLSSTYRLFAFVIKAIPVVNEATILTEYLSSSTSAGCNICRTQAEARR